MIQPAATPDRNALVSENLGLAHWVCVRFRRRYPLALRAYGTLDDMHQVAYLGLLRACTGWDPDRGALSTYAVPCIWTALLDGFRDLDSPARLPRYIRGEERAALIQQLRTRSLTHSAVAAQPITEEPLADCLALAELRQLIRAAVNKLPWKHRAVVRLYYYQSLSMREISARLRITYQRVQQILVDAQQALSRLVGGPADVTVDHTRRGPKE